jgi:hypothetical protein
MLALSHSFTVLGSLSLGNTSIRIKEYFYCILGNAPNPIYQGSCKKKGGGSSP